MDINKMSENELREELVRIRGERAGKGRQRRNNAKTNRVMQYNKDSKRRKDVKRKSEAEWI